MIPRKIPGSNPPKQKKRADCAIRISQPYEACESLKRLLVKRLPAAIWSAWRTQRHRAQFSIEYRGRDCHVRASQTYHQDQHPDRTFHGCSPYVAKSLGAEPHGRGIIQNRRKQSSTFLDLVADLDHHKERVRNVIIYQ